MIQFLKNEQGQMREIDRRILKLTIPNIISNITVPLLGMVDLAIVGHLGGSSYIGAIAIGTAIFNMLYWNFGFLRMGTSGFTAQAYGARDMGDAIRIFVRGSIVALSIALLLIALQNLLAPIAIDFMQGDEELSRLASDYFFIRIWAAPATLMLYVTKGWFIGMQNARFPMAVAIAVNIVNIAASYLLASTAGMGLKGVALGTVIAQYSGVVISLALMGRYYGKIFKRERLKGCFDLESLVRFFSINRDIFLRTLCLVAVFTFFTRASAQMGGETLAINTLLMQLFTLVSYFLDGFAYSAEALVGRYTGAGVKSELTRSVKALISWGVGIASIFTLLYTVALEPLLSIFTSDESIITAALEYRYWVGAIPLAGFMAFLYDGILIGATESAIMRNIMYIATAIFFILFYSLSSLMGDSALWLALLLYLATRGMGQFLASYKLFFR